MVAPNSNSAIEVTGVNGVGIIKRLTLLIAIVTITLSTLSAPVKQQQVNNEIEPRVEKIATAEAKKPAEVQSPQIETTTPVAEAHIIPEPVVAQTHTITGSKHDWLLASGIPESEWWAVDLIVSRESGWDPCAYNPGYSDCNANPSSACGLAQSLPCGKQSSYGHWTDPVANLKWQYEYVTQRYGGYAQAVAFWNINHWY